MEVPPAIKKNANVIFLVGGGIALALNIGLVLPNRGVGSALILSLSAILILCSGLFWGKTKRSEKRTAWSITTTVLGLELIKLVIAIIYSLSSETSNSLGAKIVNYSSCYISAISFSAISVFMIALGLRISSSPNAECTRFLSKNPANSLALFLIVFLHSACFLTFWMAFHGRNAEYPGALYRTVPGKLEFDRSANLILFEGEGDTELKCSQALLKNADVLREIWNSETPNNANRAERKPRQTQDEIYKMIARQTGETDQPNECKLNKKEMTEKKIDNEDLINIALKNVEILDSIAEHIKNKSIGTDLQIKLVGHASDVPVSSAGSFSSNLEISMARARTGQLLLDKRLNDVAASNQIGWIVSGVSNRDIWLYDEAYWLTTESGEYWREAAKNDDAKRQRAKQSTEIVLDSKRSGNSLELIDYLYFMIYTVTTTGYGDLVPFTNTAKLITSLANLFEAVFLIVFLNLLFFVFRRKGILSRLSFPNFR